MVKLGDKFGKENHSKFRSTVDRFMLMRPNIDDPKVFEQLCLQV